MAYILIIRSLWSQTCIDIFIFDRIQSVAVAGKKSDLGPIGVNVTHTVGKFRSERGLSYAELSRRLADKGREIPPLGLRRIESGERRVDVDDLVALALALGISPLALLLPTETSSLVSAGEQYSFDEIWEWAVGANALPNQPGDDLDFWRASNPLKWPEISQAINQMRSELYRKVPGGLPDHFRLTVDGDD